MLEIERKRATRGAAGVNSSWMMKLKSWLQMVEGTMGKIEDNKVIIKKGICLVFFCRWGVVCISFLFLAICFLLCFLYNLIDFLLFAYQWKKKRKEKNFGSALLLVLVWHLTWIISCSVVSKFHLNEMEEDSSTILNGEISGIRFGLATRQEIVSTNLFVLYTSFYFVEKSCLFSGHGIPLINEIWYFYLI